MNLLFRSLRSAVRQRSRLAICRQLSTAEAVVVVVTPSVHHHSHDLYSKPPNLLRTARAPELVTMHTQILPVDPSDPSISAILSRPTPSSLDDFASSFESQSSTTAINNDTTAVNGTAAQDTNGLDSSSNMSSRMTLTNLVTVAKALRQSSIPVAFPTETVYGLAADATRDAQVANVFKVKGRPGDNPLIVHFSSVQMLREFLREHSSNDKVNDKVNGHVEDPIPAIYRPLLDTPGFMPGPLSILLKIPPHAHLSRLVTGNKTMETFAARIPSSAVARAMIQLAGVPVAGPSANVSGRPSPTTATHVLNDLNGKIEYVLDGGACDVGLESTVVDGLDELQPVILRPGGVGVDQLKQIKGWEHVTVHHSTKSPQNGEAVRAPGMKYRHYAPQAKVVLVPTALAKSVSLAGYTRVGVISTGSLSTSLDSVPGTQVLVADLGADAKDVARGLFSALRDLDEQGVEVIFVEELDESRGDIAVAVMNRLRKAADEEPVQPFAEEAK
jgi:L-threonylcarbamoyladenylate synthase